jgi:hypothetical protein
MKSIVAGTAALTPARKKIGPGFARAASFVIAACVLVIAQSSAPTQLPQVHLDADGLAPRPIEELTGTTIARHYALAWRDLAEALESDRSGRIDEEFVGFAKDRLVKRIIEQEQAGVHVRIVDHGHHLKAVFYSSDGTAMQLLDQAQLEIQTFDGNKLLDTQNAPRQYMVLMTPGADRWYIRDLEEISAKSF